jgi:hypothetical protein
MDTRTKRYIDKGIKYGVPAASLGIAGTNLIINTKRRNSDRKYQEEQLKEMRRLTGSLKNATEELSSLNMENNKTIKRTQPKSIFTKMKTFSLRDNKSSSSLEGILGNEGEVKSWLVKKAEDSDFHGDSEYSTTNLLQDLDIAGGQNPHKYVVNLLYHQGLLEILFVNPRSNEVRKIDKILDSYCDKYENETGYIATQPGNNIFHVELKVKIGTELEIPKNLMEEGFKLNAII